MKGEFTPAFGRHKEMHLCSVSFSRDYKHTFDGGEDLVQVFGVVAIRSTTRADLQRVVRAVLCEKLRHKQDSSKMIHIIVSKTKRVSPSFP